MEILLVILLIILQFVYQLYTAAQRRSKRLRQGTVKKQKTSNDPFSAEPGQAPWDFEQRSDGVQQKDSAQFKQKKSGDINYAKAEPDEVSRIDGADSRSNQQTQSNQSFSQGGAFDSFLKGSKQLGKAFEDRFVAPIERAYDVMYDRDGMVVRELSNEKPNEELGEKEVNTWYYSDKTEEEKATDILKKARQRLLQKKSQTNLASKKGAHKKSAFNYSEGGQSTHNIYRAYAVKKMLKAGERKKAIVLTEIISKPIAFTDNRSIW